MKIIHKNILSLRHYSLIASLVVASAFAFQNNAW